MTGNAAGKGRDDPPLNARATAGKILSRHARFHMGTCAPGPGIPTLMIRGPSPCGAASAPNSLSGSSIMSSCTRQRVRQGSPHVNQDAVRDVDHKGGGGGLFNLHFVCGSGTRHRDHVRVQTATEFAIFKAHMWTWICGELLVDTLAMSSMKEACLSALMHTPGKQDVFSIVGVKPRGESGEGLAALAERGLEAELTQAGGSGCHTCLGAVAMMYIKVKESYTLDTCIPPTAARAAWKVPFEMAVSPSSQEQKAADHIADVKMRGTAAGAAQQLMRRPAVAGENPH
ncbi:MAG: hypothetical protein FRX49_11022 [Trebouxia sp. A1-2]|nr:MAG: hypothetical protein FRX49_11022 [Trebouxia sp. A1-2]